MNAIEISSVQPSPVIVTVVQDTEERRRQAEDQTPEDLPKVSERDIYGQQVDSYA